MSLCNTAVFAQKDRQYTNIALKNIKIIKGILCTLNKRDYDYGFA